jgi:predicted nucleic acid-binding protein
MIYLDTSYLVRLYFDDPGFAAVRELAATDHVCCALHGQAELVAAFHRKFREGAIPLKSYRALFAQFEADRKAGAFHWLPAGPEVLQRIREVYAELPGTVCLRGADAIHLATASAHGLKGVYSHDRHLLTAARHFGLQGLNVLSVA